MITGFTGTRAGMNQAQKDLVKVFLEMHKPEAVIHGDCIGADKDFDDICAGLGIMRYCCPCNLTAQRAFTDAIEWQPPKPPLERNHDIVDASNELFACPKEMREVLRSGTWATIRYARRMEKTTYVFYRDGSHE